jgi:hypothetical protein
MAHRHPGRPAVRARAFRTPQADAFSHGRVPLCSSTEIGWTTGDRLPATGGMNLPPGYRLGCPTLADVDDIHAASSIAWDEWLVAEIDGETGGKPAFLEPVGGEERGLGQDARGAARATGVGASPGRCWGRRSRCARPRAVRRPGWGWTPPTRPGRIGSTSRWGCGWSARPTCTSGLSQLSRLFELVGLSVRNRSAAVRVVRVIGRSSASAKGGVHGRGEVGGRGDPSRPTPKPAGNLPPTSSGCSPPPVPRSSSQPPATARSRPTRCPASPAPATTPRSPSTENRHSGIARHSDNWHGDARRGSGQTGSW